MNDRKRKIEQQKHSSVLKHFKPTASSSSARPDVPTDTGVENSALVDIQTTTPDLLNMEDEPDVPSSNLAQQQEHGDPEC